MSFCDSNDIFVILVVMLFIFIVDDKKFLGVVISILWVELKVILLLLKVVFVLKLNLLIVRLFFIK